jgi:hypothetical protein
VRYINSLGAKSAKDTFFRIIHLLKRRRIE